LEPADKPRLLMSNSRRKNRRSLGSAQLDPEPEDRRSERMRGGGSVLQFLAFFGLLLGAFYAVMLLPWSDRVFYEYLLLNAKGSGAILRWLGEDVQRSGVTLRSVDYAISIRRGCDAVEPAWFFCAAVLAFPAPWRRKIAVLFGGTAAILALNFVRIVSLYFVGLRLPAFFPMAHLELWPALFIVGSLALWIAWMRSVLPPPPDHSNGRP
jgi:exosortase H (IPTLxxWG-CTERM-specific)